MSATNLTLAVAQFGALLLVGWVFGDFMLRRAGRGSLPRGVGLPERALVAIAGFVAFSVALMIAHIVTRGAVFGLVWPVPAAGAATVIVLVGQARRPSGVPWAGVALCVALLIAIYAAPMLLAGSPLRRGDPSWHLGWTEQLLAGDPVPTGPAPRFTANAYPWGWHAVLATLVRLIPPSNAMSAHDALQLVLVLAIPLAAACLARRVDERASWAAAAAAGAGGFGWLWARGPDFITSPRAARYGADLVVASPNAAYELFPPPFPRELGLVLLGAAATLLVISMMREDGRVGAIAGLVAGCAGLVSLPMLLGALVWFVPALVAMGRKGRHLAVWVLAPIPIVVALWAAPFAVNLVRFGGLVDVSEKLGLERPFVVAVASWGIVFPAATAGLWLAARACSAGRVLAVFAAGSVLLLVLARARAEFDWQLAGQATLLHQGRIWPALHLIGAALAGVAAWWVLRRLHALSRPGAFLAALLAGTVAVASPLLASVALRRIVAEQRGGFVLGRTDLQPGSFVRRSAEVLGPEDVVRLEGSLTDSRQTMDDLGLFLFQFSGVRLDGYDNPHFDGNDARIRYRDLAAAYDRAEARGGFEADYVVVCGPAPGRGLIAGTYEGTSCVLRALPPR